MENAAGRGGRDNGFTLVELMMVTVLMGVIGTLALTAFVGYQRSADLEGSADDVVSALRSTAQRSVTEGRTYCVRFDTTANSYTVYRSSCATGSTVVQAARTTRGPAIVSAPSFSAARPGDVCQAANACAYFYPRGTGSPGTVKVQRVDGKSITVTIEGLTSRVVRS